MIEAEKRSKQTSFIIEKMKKIAEEEKQCQEKPKISDVSRKMGENRNKNIPIQDRYQDEQKLKDLKLQKKKQELDQMRLDSEKACTFKPTINSNYSLQSRENFNNPTITLENRNKKIEKMRLDQLIEQSDNLTFQPKINENSERIFLESDNVGFLDRMENYRLIKEEKLERIRDEVNLESWKNKEKRERKMNRSFSRQRLDRSVSTGGLRKMERSVSRNNDTKNDKIMKLKNIVKKSGTNQQMTDPNRDQFKPKTDNEQILKNGNRGNSKVELERNQLKNQTEKEHNVRKSSGGNTKVDVEKEYFKNKTENDRIVKKPIFGNQKTSFERNPSKTKIESEHGIKKKNGNFNNERDFLRNRIESEIYEDDFRVGKSRNVNKRSNGGKTKEKAVAVNPKSEYVPSIRILLKQPYLN